METIRGLSKNPIALGVIGLVVGAILGLVVLGWWLWPVKWVDASPQHLNYSEKVSFLRQAIEAYGYNADGVKAAARYQALGEDAEQVLSEITQNPEDLSPAIIAAFSGAALASPPAGQLPAGELPSGTPPAEPVEEAKDGGLSLGLILLLCVVGLAIIGAVVYFLFIRKRFEGVAEPTPARVADENRRQAPLTDYAASGVVPPIAQFMASYNLGDDLFDDSFSIDSTSGEFLGECGVGISETIGVGDPKKVTALEVWLFDKNDIQTVTKVLMSEHAYHDVSVRQRLETKGEAVLANDGDEVVLDTQTLQLVARVVKREYGDSAMPERSFFKTFLLELAIWQKEEV